MAKKKAKASVQPKPWHSFERPNPAKPVRPDVPVPQPPNKPDTPIPPNPPRRSDDEEPRIVAAAGTAVKMGSNGAPGRAQLIEAAMTRAIEQCIQAAADAGKPYPSDDEIRAAKMDAYEQARSQLG